jgi:hypothetical protein
MAHVSPTSCPRQTSPVCWILLDFALSEHTSHVEASKTSPDYFLPVVGGEGFELPTPAL